ncbi:hypothetical protein PC129_g17491 [Phytophthora cactorum]|uniref:Uncharacterized protein n=1 Tax=Phytophthora cactorum TaxID=29920 RepID=A0A8T1BU14_9STRA|nr:hypothetical protein Pcac1_g7380 [Phytophthora cactorum]KAG2906811.1 hypothetical protein PC114_g11038 [Phytophthora cactorum]KAG2907376.1 hypothetical protein PC117_g20233 [Phytophthora cactorum]KAG2986052.1 hypothetical protein PC119_g20018 [Phytophthora cactorum]KAG3158514.1 hypothetical protein PC128_g21497 [Phytophthora cactorum]
MVDGICVKPRSMPPSMRRPKTKKGFDEVREVSEEASLQMEGRFRGEESQRAARKVQEEAPEQEGTPTS